jgi:hypothetical protein
MIPRALASGGTLGMNRRHASVRLIRILSMGSVNEDPAE